MQVFKHWINGRWESENEDHSVFNPYNGELVSQFGIANSSEAESAIRSAEKSVKPFKNTSRYVRSRLLNEMKEIIKSRRSDLTSIIIQEAGKPVMLAEAEVTRCINTFQNAAEETLRFDGELYPMDIEPMSISFDSAIVRMFPRGIVFAITPFNFPLNLVAHKVAPALAVGAPIILKPAPQAPGAAFILAEIFEEALLKLSNLSERIPPEAFQVLYTENELAEKIVKDKRISTISFTGSAPVGWKIQEMGVGKKVLLELGGNAAVIVCKDADIKLAAARIAFGANSYAGQSCISVQRIYVDKEIYHEFKTVLTEEFHKVAYGDPAKKETLVGPVIDRKSKDRILEWIEEAKEKEATILFGGVAINSVISPTLLENVSAECKVYSEEVFGPVAVLDTFWTIEDAIQKVNSSKYGLHAGVFTSKIQNVQKVFKDLEVGGVLVNEVPTFRADHMPYGGVKESGLGREGVKYTMEEYCERKTLVMKI